MGTGEFNLRWTSIPSTGRVEILLVALYQRTRDKLRPDGSLGSCAELPLMYVTAVFLAFYFPMLLLQFRVFVMMYLQHLFTVLK